MDRYSKHPRVVISYIVLGTNVIKLDPLDPTKQNVGPKQFEKFCKNSNLELIYLSAFK